MWRQHGNRSESHRWPVGEDLVRDCEAFLSGCLVDQLIDRHEPVPDWVWLNVLAHGGEEEIAALAGETAAPNPAWERSWRQALELLAHEIITAECATGSSLLDLQRRVLIPLELELAEQGGQPPFGPGQLVGRVLCALNEYRARQPR